MRRFLHTRCRPIALSRRGAPNLWRRCSRATTGVGSPSAFQAMPRAHPAVPDYLWWQNSYQSIITQLALMHMNTTSLEVVISCHQCSKLELDGGCNSYRPGRFATIDRLERQKSPLGIAGHADSELARVALKQHLHRFGVPLLECVIGRHRVCKERSAAGQSRSESTPPGRRAPSNETPCWI